MTYFEIMVVDDNDDELLLTKYWLERRSPNIKVCGFLDAEEAANEIRRRIDHAERLPQLVTVDINMPRYNGIAVAQSLLRLLDRDETMVGMLTGSVNAADRAAALKIGARFYAIKPLDAQCLDDIGRQIGAFHVMRINGELRVARGAPSDRAEGARRAVAETAGVQTPS